MARTYVVPGDMDASTMKQQREVFEGLAAGGQDVVIDMSNVEFIDSSGVGGLVFIYKRLLESGRKLTLVNLPPQADQLLTFLRLKSILSQ